MTRRHDPSWRETIDGWIRDPAIRRYSLSALAMLLAAAVLISGMAIAGFGAAASSVLPSPLTKSIPTISTTLGASGIGWWLIRRHRRRAAAPADKGVTTPEAAAGLK
jgi:hypothetical protein